MVKRENRNEFWEQRLLLISIFLLGVILRIYDLDQKSLRLDETQSVWQASHSLSFIWEYMLKNVHLPLHNTLLHFWMRMFGTSETALRSLAVIPGILSLPALYFLAKELVSKRAATVAYLLAAISPFWIWYSREIRMYTLLTLITILSYLFYVKIMKTNKLKYYLLYILVNAIGMYIHYFFFLVLFVQAVFFVSTIKKTWVGGIKYSKKKQFSMFSVTALLLALIFSPWAIALSKSYGSGSLAPVLHKPTAFNVILSFFEFTFGYQPDLLSSALISFWPLVILFGFIFLTKRKSPFSMSFDFVLLGTVFPVFFIFFVSLVYKPMYLTRYLTTATPLFFILVAWYLNELVGRTRYILTGLLVTSFGVALYIQQTSIHNPAIENYREAVSYIELNISPRDVVIVSPPYTLYPFQYYYDGTNKVSSIPLWNKKKGGIPTTTLQNVEEGAITLQKGHQSMYLLLTNNLQGSDIVKGYFDMHYTQLGKKQFSKDIWVYEYKAEYY